MPYRNENTMEISEPEEEKRSAEIMDNDFILLDDLVYARSEERPSACPGTVKSQAAGADHRSHPGNGMQQTERAGRNGPFK